MRSIIICAAGAFVVTAFFFTVSFFATEIDQERDSFNTRFGAWYCEDAGCSPADHPIKSAPVAEGE